jgi:predicted PurR-regulated permease PerM
MRSQIDQARWIAVLVATALALYLCWLMLRPFIGVLAWAVVLVIVFYPVHQRLALRFKRPGLGALLSCILVVLLAVLPLTVLTIAVAEELAKVVPNLPAQISHLMNPETSPFGGAAEWIQGRFGVDPFRSQEFMVNQLQRVSGFMLGFSLSVAGVVSIAALQGLLGGIAFWILGIPSPLLWAVLMTFICMIPILGSFLVWVPLAIYLIATGHMTKAVLLILWGALVISTIDNFLRPKLIKNQTHLHELFVFFSVLGGISVFGLLGIVLGPVVLAITLGLLQTFRAHQS